MKYNRKKLAGFILLFSIILVSNSSNPPNGKTGAPGEQTCAQSGCHTGTNPALDGDITITGLPATIMGGSTHNITVTVDNPNGAASRAGFQWTVLDGGNVSAGTISNASASSVVSLSGGRSYHEHSPAVSFPGSNVVTWTADWTAPTGPNGENITIYGIANIANGSGTSNDRIKLTTATGTLMATTPPLTATITGSTDALCFLEASGTATVTAMDGTPPYSYSWDNGEMMATATMLTAGTHTVTVTDAGSGNVTAQVTIGQPAFLNGFIDSFMDATCGMDNGTATASASGGTPGYSFAWSDGQSGPIAVNLAVGQYFCTVTDMNMCETMFGLFINDVGGTILVNTINFSDVTCNGDSDGLIEVLGLNGTPPYSYSWNTGQSTALIENLPPASYVVTVTDDNMCSATSTVVVTEPAELTIDMSNVTNVSCNGEMDGLIAPIVDGGLGVISYIWSDGSINDSLINVVGDLYTLTVTDENGCSAVGGATVIDPPLITLTMSSTPETGAGAMNGTASVFANGGTPDFGYLWNNGEKTATIENLSPGIYMVTVSDANDCTAVGEVTVNAGSCDLLANGMVTDVACFGEDSGSITLDPSNFVDPVIYVWSTGASTATISDLLAGEYTVILTDAIGCTSMDTFMVNQPDELVLTEDIINNPDCVDSTNGMLSIWIEGGVPPFTYMWNNGEANDTLFMVAPGMYSCIVTDGNMCQKEIDFDIVALDQEAPIPFIVETLNIYVDNSGNTPMIDATDFDLGSVDNCIISSVTFPDSSYTCADINQLIELPVVFEDPTGNMALDTFEIIVRDTFPPEITCMDDMTINSCESFTFDDPLHFDNCSSTLTQIAGPVSGSVFNPGDNVITFRAEDTDGNFTDCSFTISVEVDLVSEVISTDATCFGFSDGTAIISPSGGTAPYVIDPVIDLNFLMAGEYPFSVTDDEGCVILDTIFISEPEVLLIADFSITDAATSNSNDGAIDITVSGGTMDYQYEWFLNGAMISMDEDLTDLAPGLYMCVVTDAAGCTYESIEYEVSSTVGTDDLGYEKDLALYPNPVSDILTIALDNSSASIQEINLLSVNGAVLKKILVNNSKTQLNINEYPKGIHLVRIVVEDQVIIKKVLFQ